MKHKRNTKTENPACWLASCLSLSLPLLCDHAQFAALSSLTTLPFCVNSRSNISCKICKRASMKYNYNDSKTERTAWNSDSVSKYNSRTQLKPELIVNIFSHNSSLGVMCAFEAYRLHTETDHTSHIHRSPFYGNIYSYYCPYPG